MDSILEVLETEVFNENVKTKLSEILNFSDEDSDGYKSLEYLIAQLVFKNEKYLIDKLLFTIHLAKKNVKNNVNKTAALIIFLEKMMVKIQNFNSELNEILFKELSLAKEILKKIVQSIPVKALQGDMTLFRNLKGLDLLKRVKPYHEWRRAINDAGLWLFDKTSTTAPKNSCEAIDYAGNKLKGINFASQDYLGLSSHPKIVELGKKTIEEYGVHSAGSAVLFGNTKFSTQLEQTISKFLGYNYTVLYPTGWGAGFGVVTGLIRPSDHVVMDRLSHACLQTGAKAATNKRHYFSHLDNQEVEKILKKIRTEDKKNAILVVTESLFSMDSDSPNLEVLQKICKSHSAFLLVDMAHDLGCIGEKGLGNPEIQEMIEKIDIVMGSFSKTFASNGGFVCTDSKAVLEYLSFFSNPRTFSNALSPAQAACVNEAFLIVQSPEGKKLRKDLLERSLYLREKLSNYGLKCIGSPSAIIPVVIGDEGLTRILTRLLADHGIITNIVEYPGVAKGAARLRIQIMAGHTYDELDFLAKKTKSCLAQAKLILSTIKSDINLLSEDTI
ncbi:MAG: pyridoxal phosphate-dependent aminotransferase family protein [Proteobacteria bacterium]|nr:pyridoxal phosphate-dependent aminotransferase family protein [Pseudomonadota bacterium]